MRWQRLRALLVVQRAHPVIDDRIDETTKLFGRHGLHDFGQQSRVHVRVNGSTVFEIHHHTRRVMVMRRRRLRLEQGLIQVHHFVVKGFHAIGQSALQVLGKADLEGLFALRADRTQTTFAQVGDEPGIRLMTEKDIIQHERLNPAMEESISYSATA